MPHVCDHFCPLTARWALRRAQRTLMCTSKSKGSIHSKVECPCGNLYMKGPDRLYGLWRIFWKKLVFDENLPIFASNERSEHESDFDARGTELLLSPLSGTVDFSNFAHFWVFTEVVGLISPPAAAAHGHDFWPRLRFSLKRGFHNSHAWVWGASCFALLGPGFWAREGICPIY